MAEKTTTTAERLRYILETENIKQADILERCMPYLEQFKIKMNRSDISQYIAGKATPKQNKLYILARALNVSEAWLMGYDVEKERKERPEPALIVSAQTINERIKSRRQALGISVDYIAEKLNINRATYYRYESNEIEKIPADIIEPLAEILKTSPQALMGWSFDDNKTGSIIEIETLAKDMNESQLNRLVEYAKMLKQYNEGKL
ncbi:MAG: helix-turn-helix domain-containing protein [Alphaproteobacteria bacterium]|nr:helix-turn-helix domain-containing protein [Alphaproteobacteria bacterium]